MKSTKYEVVIEKYAERHFISKFKKKYKGSWDLTLNTLIENGQYYDFVHDPREQLAPELQRVYNKDISKIFYLNKMKEVSNIDEMKWEILMHYSSG